MESNKNKAFGWIALFGTVLAIRLLTLVLSPLSLGGDEAQYWHWSLHPAWGYFSKPPLLAWLISLTSALGESVASIRLAAPLLHAATAGLLYATARTLWPDSRQTAWLAAALYFLLPVVFLSSFIISTDAPLLTFGAVALLAWARWREKAEWGHALLFGAALGLAFLAKYAMLFLLAGFLLLAVLDTGWRRHLVSAQGLVSGLLILAVISPNLLWNQAHHFATFSHVVSNVDADDSLAMSELVERAANLLTYWASQLGVAGPLVFIFLILALISGLRATRSTPVFGLAILTLVPLIIISAQAFLSRANANWAVLAYVPGMVLLAHWLVRGNIKAWKWGIVGPHLALGAIFVTVLLAPAQFMHTPIFHALNPLRGWSDTAHAIEVVYDRGAPDGRPYSGIITDIRIPHYALSWEWRNRPDLNLRMWSRYATPHSQRELKQPLPKGDTGPWLMAIFRANDTSYVVRDFNQMQLLSEQPVDLGGGETRHLALYAVEGYDPVPRTTAYEKCMKALHVDDGAPQKDSQP